MWDSTLYGTIKYIDLRETGIPNKQEQTQDYEVYEIFPLFWHIGRGDRIGRTDGRVGKGRQG